MSEAAKCFRCLGLHAAIRCDDGIHHGSALPYPQVARHPEPPTTQTGGREWWIEFEGDPTRDKYKIGRYVGGEAWVSGYPSHEVVHVIEYAAYEKLKVEMARSAALIEAIQSTIAGQSVNTCEAMRSNLREALKKWSDT